MAESDTETLPDEFVRIANADDLTEDGVYLIGAVIPALGKFYLLSNTSSSNWLAASELCEEADISERIDGVSDKLKWRITYNSDGTFYLTSASNGKHVFSQKTESTYLSVSNSKHTSWAASCQEDQFLFKNADNSKDRYLLLSYYETVRFGNYSEKPLSDNSYSHYLYVYKGTNDTDKGSDGDAVMPTDGSATTICAGEKATDSNLQPVSLSGRLLHNGSVAPDSVASWTCQHRTDSSFVLNNGEGGFLGHDLAISSNEELWYIRGGRVYTDGQEGRVLCLYDGCFTTIQPDSIGYAESAILRLVGEMPDSTTNGGNKALSGAWSAQRLNALKWDGVSELDLTQICLPAQALSFTTRPSGTNSIIYVNGDDASLISAQWPFVVGCDGDGNTLLTPTELQDKQPLIFSQEIQVPSGMLTYSRQAYADGMWETLYLPFLATLPNNFSAEQQVDISGDVLTFEDVTEIEAYMPLIIRYTGTVSDSHTIFSVESEACTLYPNATAGIGNGLNGTLKSLTVSSATEGIYLLNPEGDSFVLSDNGSHLAPFRAYVNLETRTNRLTLRHMDSLTGIANVEASETVETSPCYLPDGRLISTDLAPADRTGLPKGIYIIGGKKLFIP